MVERCVYNLYGPLLTLIFVESGAIELLLVCYCILTTITQMSLQQTDQKAGRSSSRFIEDLLFLIPGKHEWLKNPIEQARQLTLRPYNPLYVVEPSPEPPMVDLLDGSSTSFYFIFGNNLHHVELIIDHGNDANGVPLNVNSIFNVDPESFDFHLDSALSVINSYNGEEVYYFNCLLTHTSLKVIIRPPEFTQDDLQQFTEPQIQARFERYHAFKPTAVCPTPAQCFLTLYKVLEQPMVSMEKKEMKTDNPTLNMRMDPQLLLKFGFTVDESRNAYVPPDLHDFTNPKTVALRRVMARRLLEVATRAFKYPGKAAFHFHLENALPMLQRRLGCQSYVFLDPRDLGASSVENIAAYMRLGAGERDSDDGLIKRYELQCRNDPANAPVYLESLKNISETRGSEALQIKVVELMSLGAVVSSDVNTAYSKFHMEPESQFDPDVLIQTYRDSVQGLSNSSKSDYRNALKVIANNSSNQRLQDFLAIEDMSVESAYAYLEASPQDTDDSIAVLFDVKTRETQESDNRSGYEKAKHALLTIAKDRNSPRLFSVYENVLDIDNELPVMSIDAAYELLGLDSTVDVDNIIAVYEIRLKDNPAQVMDLRSALRAITKSRKIELLRHYLETGSTEGAPGKISSDGDLNLPVGLNNIGNTCYLNSLLQFYFTITPIREAVCSFPNSEDKEDISGLGKKHIVKKVGGRAVPVWEVARAQQFVLLLHDLFQELIHTKSKSVSPTKDLAYLALIPSGDEPDEDLEIVLEEEEEYSEAKPVSNDRFGEDSETDIEEPVILDVKKRQPDTDKNQLSEGSDTDRAMIDLSDSPMIIDTVDENKENSQPSDSQDCVVIGSQKMRSPPPLPPTVAPTKRRRSSVAINATGEEKIKRIDNALMGRQQDVTECIENVLFQIEAAFKATGKEEEDGEQLDLVKELFYGTTKQVLASAVDGSHRREKVERFNSLLVDVADGPRDIYDALDAALQEQVFDLEDGKTLRTMSIKKLPPILQIQVQRVQYDRVLHQPFKSLALLEFQKVIYMDRYLDTTDDSVLLKRRQVTSWRRELKSVTSELEVHRLRQSNNSTMLENLKTLKDYFEQLDDDHELKPKPETIAVLKDQISQQQQKDKQLEEKIESLKRSISNAFSDKTQEAYRIHSVFIHKGQASFGHYWIYIYDHENDIYRKYNDETITEASESQVFDMEENNTATPYFLVYVKENLYDDYTKSVVRRWTESEPISQQALEARDVEAKDVEMNMDPLSEADYQLEPL